MPYISAKDRKELDPYVEPLAESIAAGVGGNYDVLHRYKVAFLGVGVGVCEHDDRISNALSNMLLDAPTDVIGSAATMAQAICRIADGYAYNGASLGLLNYSMTRVIQRVPQLMVAKHGWKPENELRYWLYAVTTEALAWASSRFISDSGPTSGCGVGGVFEDVKDEYKRRVNTSYEAAQILKSGDCYDTPYYTRLVAVVDSDGKEIGHVEIMLKRSSETVGLNVYDGNFVLARKK